ncbi:MAG TPA: DnaJ domain-containing protein [Oligoflexia bacterium]|nr:DnaJ domain-containing protein [Oligoflexia bacterium]HMP47423.1 DnaJ domain-containing protein [Oligoflexia bacterium]
MFFKKPNESQILLGFDRASSAFRLIFLFVQDQSLPKLEQVRFETIIGDVFKGLSLPKSAIKKLKNIYSETLANPPPLRKILLEVSRDFSNEREGLVNLVKILLGLISENGMISSRHCFELKELLDEFKFSESELEYFSEEEEALFYSALGRNKYASGIIGFGKDSETLKIKLCSILGCKTDSSITTIKRAYRKKVMELHPDRSMARMEEKINNPEEVNIIKASFEELQEAYLEFMKISEKTNSIK